MTPLRPRSRPEAALQRELRTLLEARGWLVIKTHGSTYCSGLPDLLCVREGVQLWVEVKRPKGGRLTRAQAVLFPRLKAAGVLVHVVRSVEELEAVL